MQQPAPVPPVGVVHGSRLLREGIGGLLARAGVEVMASFAGGREVLAAGLPADCLLLYDLATARADGADVVSELHRRLPGAKILMFNVSDDDRAIVECVRVGASGCVLQDASLEDLLAAIHSLASGTPAHSPRVITSLFTYVAQLAAGEERPAPTPLTPREEQILALLLEGLSNKEIADRLVLQPQTVKNYVHLVLEKLGLRDRLEAIRTLRSAKH